MHVYVNFNMHNVAVAYNCDIDIGKLL